MVLTTEIARELQRKSLISRRENVARNLANAAKIPQLEEIALTVASNSVRFRGEISVEPFQAETLDRVRKQIRIVLARIEESKDSKTTKEWTDAFSRLAEVERQLAGRPMPGSLKPQQPRRANASSEPIPEPIQAAPMPVAQGSPAPAKTPQARLNCGVAPTMYSVQLFVGDPQQP